MSCVEGRGNAVRRSEASLDAGSQVLKCHWERAESLDRSHLSKLELRDKRHLTLTTLSRCLRHQSSSLCQPADTLRSFVLISGIRSISQFSSHSFVRRSRHATITSRKGCDCWHILRSASFWQELESACALYDTKRVTAQRV